MNRSYFGRVVGVLVVAFGLAFSLLSGTASAQVHGSVPKAQVQAGDIAYGAVAPPGPSAVAQVGTFSACGWSSPIYRHCGQNQFVLVRADFAWSWDTADIWVTRGETDLVWRFGRQIDNAWCVQNCG